MRRLLLLLLVFPCLLSAQNPEIRLVPGLAISQSCRIIPETYRLKPGENPQGEKAAQGVVTIAGDNIVVDFQNADLRSTADPARPDLFTGLAILVTGQNVTLKNARVRGFKVALLARDAAGLTLDNCDFSYNYRPRLRSIREREDFSDWLSYHQNDKGEWLRYGAAMYLDNCQRPTVRNCRVTACQNALLLNRCNDGLVYNNTFQFNSGLGIGLYRSSNNRLMHNRLDWNVRGYSHGFYQRGQDSAGILLYEQSSNNLIAFNSATHSGDGLFLWAGQSTMDKGQGGCNDNYIFGNDFSHAPTNGIEVTFSRNRIQANMITECTYGIWGGYSYETLIWGNLITNCRTGIAIEHGQQDTILQNYFADDSTGIQLWARDQQPADWGYAQHRDTRSRDNHIDRNVFVNVRKPLKISASQNITLNGENLFWNFDRLLETGKANDKLQFVRNDLYAPAAKIEDAWANPELAPQRNLNFSHPGQAPADPYEPLLTPVRSLKEPDSLPDGILAALPPDWPRGRNQIIVGEWGPYDFQRPIAVLESVEGLQYRIRLYGPKGRWGVLKSEGVATMQSVTPGFPALIEVERDPKADGIWLQFEYIGDQAATTVFGEIIPPGKSYAFDFQRFEKTFSWKLRFFNYTDESDPLKNPAGFDKLLRQTPAAEKTVPELAFAWWDKPADGVDAEHFATVAETEFTIAKGRYKLELCSDDGARLYLDGKRLIDHWDVHEPATDEVIVSLNGKHRLRVEHFEAGGFSTLDLRMTPVR
ncbi:MAG: right-handed parallel beta-helix repeat-containing protein [Saprospiraceae bacterium]|nr:right-handed parallel beta-helix repeat-containing protein [Saprospiraceae bacterium]